MASKCSCKLKYQTNVWMQLKLMVYYTYYHLEHSKICSFSCSHFLPFSDASHFPGSHEHHGMLWIHPKKEHWSAFRRSLWWIFSGDTWRFSEIQTSIWGKFIYLVNLIWRRPKIYLYFLNVQKSFTHMHKYMYNFIWLNLKRER